MTQPQIGHFDSIAIAAIRPSPTNPRKHFDDLAMMELQRSIEEMGVQQPLLLRPMHEGEGEDRRAVHHDMGGNIRVRAMEIVAGERRWRAAKAAGREFVPAIVREMTDAEVVHIQLVENLQRADLHPMEEAEAYQILLAGGTTVEEIAKRTGKATSYIAQRLKLLSLEIDARKIFGAGHMTIGHALLLARLTTRDQERALIYLLKLSDWDIKNGQSVSQAIATRVKEREKPYSGGAPQRVVDPTEAELRQWIDKNVLLVLEKAPWDLADATLVPEAGPCTTCPKRSGANAALFSDITTREDVCMDPACFAAKQKETARRHQQIAKKEGAPLLKISTKTSHDKLEQPAVKVENDKAVVVTRAAVRQGQWVPAEKDSCASTILAVVTDGPEVGVTRHVCANQKCTVHKHQVATPRMSIAASAARKETDEEREARVAAESAERRVRIDALQYIVINSQTWSMHSEARRLFQLEVENMYEGAFELAQSLEIDLAGAGDGDSAAMEALEKWASDTKAPELLEACFIMDNLGLATFGERSRIIDLGKKHKVNVASLFKKHDDAVAKANKQPPAKEVGDSKKSAKKAAAKKAVK